MFNTINRREYYKKSLFLTYLKIPQNYSGIVYQQFIQMNYKWNEIYFSIKQQKSLSNRVKYLLKINLITQNYNMSSLIKCTNREYIFHFIRQNLQTILNQSDSLWYNSLDKNNLYKKLFTLYQDQLKNIFFYDIILNLINQNKICISQYDLFL
ncbi:hypothetical protein pb186bvf_014187 [Paramecium bursaria]